MAKQEAVLCNMIYRAVQKSASQTESLREHPLRTRERLNALDVLFQLHPLYH